MDHYKYLSFDRRNDISPLELFIEGDELYFIEAAGADWRFGYVSRRLDTTVTVTVSDDALLSGADILLVLRAAMLCYPDEVAVEKALTDAGVPQNPMKRALWMAPPVPGTDDTAYRTFLSTRDLECLFSFPSQPSTAACARILLVDATMTPMPGSRIFMPDAPLVRKFMTVYPAGVRLSERDGVFFDSQLTVTYTDPGHEDSSHTLIAGHPSPFVTYYGAAICVQPLSRLGIELKPLPLKISDDNDGGRKVTLVLRFTDDRAITSSLSLDPESSEYSLLRAGTWHGYRARRMVVKCHGDESYLVDLRFTTEPSVDEAQQRPDAGKAENERPQKRKRRRRTNPWFYVCLTLMAVIAGMVIVYFLPGFLPRTIPDYAPGILEMPSDTLDPEEPVINMPVTVVEPAPEPEFLAPADTAVVAPEPAPEADTSVISDADRAYLDSNTVWRRSDLSSPAAIALFDLFAKADLRAIASHPYLADRKCRNARASQIAVLAWQALGSDTQVSNRRALQQLEGQPQIDLTELYVKLDKLRSASPNTRPRP
ncbi:MAG: hypothetical protein K2M57_09485 [Paramuribaculum sp.]|nr:hypothetical protein [Paramuribaculum sp.]